MVKTIEGEVRLNELGLRKNNGQGKFVSVRLGYIRSNSIDTVK